jgi:hypothetical protein
VNTPERSAAIAKALDSQSELPGDFARRVALLAEARAAARHAVGNYATLLVAFAAMLGICVAGWYAFEPRALAVGEWVGPTVRALAAQPWLLIGVAGFALIQALTFRRRART